MKLSEFIERLQELKTVNGGDPDVLIGELVGYKWYYENATAELSYVVMLDDPDIPYVACDLPEKQQGGVRAVVIV